MIDPFVPGYVWSGGVDVVVVVVVVVAAAAAADLLK